MSSRSDLQARIVDFISQRSERYNAPYGVLSSLQDTKRGKVRTVTYGIARLLDATVYIYSSTSILLKTSRGSTFFNGPNAEQQLYAELEK